MNIPLNRKILNNLKHWKDSKDRKVLLLRGARQVGKTYVVRKLGESFEDFIEINFYETPEVIKFFEEGDLNPTKIIEKLAAYFQKSIIPGKTLLFFDEIQACQAALSSLRFFYEKLPELHVVAAGSLLEFVLDEIPSFGVGRITSIFMYPLSIEEFFEATNNQGLLAEIKKSDYENSVTPILHKKACDLLRVYSCIGGLPNIVATYVRDRDINLCSRELDSILLSYRDDFAKYREKVDVVKLDETLKSAALQAGGKFKYSKINSVNSSYWYDIALNLLLKAGLLNKVTHSSSNGIPLGAEIKSNHFKIFIFDVGVYNRLLGLNLGKIFLESEESFVNSGAIAELITAQELIAHSSPFIKPELYYWVKEERSGNAEVDFVVQVDNLIYPIEVKAGTKGAMQSMYRFLLEKKRNLGFRISLENYGKVVNQEGQRINILPLYDVGRVLEQ